MGDTIMLAPVAPLDQMTSPSQPEAVRVDEPPVLIVDGEAVTVGAASGVTVMV